MNELKKITVVDLSAYKLLANAVKAHDKLMSLSEKANGINATDADVLRYQDYETAYTMVDENGNSLEKTFQKFTACDTDDKQLVKLLLGRDIHGGNATVVAKTDAVIKAVLDKKGIADALKDLCHEYTKNDCTRLNFKPCKTIGKKSVTVADAFLYSINNGLKVTKSGRVDVNTRSIKQWHSMINIYLYACAVEYIETAENK